MVGLPDYSDATLEKAKLANTTVEECFDARHSAEYAHQAATDAFRNAYPEVGEADRSRFVRDAINLWYGDPNDHD